MARHTRTRPLRTRILRTTAGIFGVLTAGIGAMAATNWIVGLNSGSSGEAQSAAISNLTISATASPSAANLLYPGSNGDVVLTISNPNSFPVTITALSLPDNTTYAGGYTDSALSSAQAGCTSSNSTVAWTHATGSNNTSHPLSSPLTVAANGQSSNPLTVTLTNEAAMGTSAPLACANTY